jgi:hypothetical protein
LGGDVASILTENPVYQKRAQEFGQQQHEDLLKRRLENLSALRDNYAQQADAARQLGNIEAEGTLRAKQDSVLRQSQLIQEQLRNYNQQAAERLRQKGAQELERLRQEGKAKTAQATSAEIDPDVIDANIVKTDFGDFIDRSKFTAKQLPALQKAAAQSGARIVDTKTANQLGELQSAWRMVQDQVAQVMPYLSETNDPFKRAGIGARNIALKASGSTALSSLDAMWGSSMRLLRATGPSTGFRFNKSEIDRSMKYDRPNTITDTQPILMQKARNWQTLIANASRPNFSTDWRSIATPNGKVTVMGPDGQTKDVSFVEAERLVTTQGYARVFGAEQLSAPIPQQPPGNSQKNQTPGPKLPAKAAKAKALAAARRSDWDGLNAIIDANPELDDDPDINDLIDNMQAK